VFAGVIVTWFFVMTPQFIGDGLDASWQAALLQARYLDLGFGNQIIFSGGPLSHVYSRTFSSSLFHERFLAALVFSAFYVTFFANAAARNKNIFSVIVGAMPFLFSILTDPIYLGLPLCASLVGTHPDRRGGLVVAFGAIASAIATLAKFSVFPMAMVGFLVVDYLSLRNRRFPITLIVYALSTAALFFVTSPNGAFVDFLRNSLDVSAGYSEAMSLSGSIREVGLIFTGALIILSMVATGEFRNVRADGLPVEVALGRILIVGVFLLIVIKSGLVRHDAHAIIAWAGLEFIAAAYCAFSWRQLSPRHAIGFVVLTVAGVVFTCNSWTQYTGLSPYQVVSSQIGQRRQDLANWLNFLSGPQVWLASQQAKQQAFHADLRGKHPWPALDGAVDVIPSRQSSLIANDLRYQPRPSIQEYATYTRGLIEKNRAFIRSERAPDFVLMEPYALDGRHPAFAEGSIWPDLLARYAPQDVIDGMTVLRKREHSLELPMRTVETSSGTIDKKLVMKRDLQGAIFAHIDLQPTSWGRLASLVFKSAILYIDIEYTNGSQGRYRFLPAIAREGFFLSPLISNNEAYLQLSAGLATVNPLKVKSFTIRPGTLARWLWSKQFLVRLDSMEDDALRADIVRSEMTPRARQRLELSSVVYQAPNAKLGVLREGLLAHAPTKFRIAAHASRTLDVGFGIMDSAWKDNANTDGVCFRISVAGEPAPIWERCLDPKRVAADRGPQQAAITLPEATDGVELETVCGKNCAWDWSYWSRISLR
jgi:hypothetical protein